MPRPRTVHRLLIAAILIHVAVARVTAQHAPAPGEWSAWGRDAGGMRWSPLAGIDRGSVAGLEVAWVYRTGDLLEHRGRFQSTPLVVGGRLYVTSPLGRVSAVEPATGRELWTYDPGVDLGGDYGDFANRGVAYWRATADRPGDVTCAARVFIATIDARLIALDARSGTRCADFGDDGVIDLTAELRSRPNWPGEYQVTSPPAVIGDRIVVGSAIADNQRIDAPSGTVRAFDARTGALVWGFDPVPQDPADPAYGTWRGERAHETGAANAWAPLSVDAELGLVYVPTSSPSPDFYGGERLGRNDYANSVVALEAGSGRVRWHFQVVRHDLWDYDIAAQPVLFPFRRGGETIPAVAVATKMGHVFLLDRRTGEPLHAVEERPVPASTVPGEIAWPTQPFPSHIVPLHPYDLDLDGPLGATAEDARYCRERLAQLRYEGIFTPPSFEGTLIYPGNIGGMQWGGVSIDPQRGIGVAPVNRLPFVVTLVPQDEVEARRRRYPGQEISRQRGTPYAVHRQVLLAPSGAPCAPPPWGTLGAVDLASGALLWQVPLGSAAPAGAPASGLPSMGGALLTAGGLAFMAGTPDRMLRSFDIETGTLLWQGELPADALATPMTFEADGRQFVAIAAGGHDRMRAFSNTPLGDYLVAFALPAAGGTRTPAPTLPDPAGAWVGEMRGGGNRFVTTLSISAGDAADTRTAHLSAPDFSFEARLAAEPAGDGFRATGTFRVDGDCSGPALFVGDVANHGTLLVGMLRVEGSCFDDGVGTGTFFFRRPPGYLPGGHPSRPGPGEKRP
jgi:quinoprotein glucose dehydrogenase